MLEEQPSQQIQHAQNNVSQQHGQQLVLNALPLYLTDSLPRIEFDATIGCLLEHVDKSLSLEQFVEVLSQPDIESIPAIVLIDARGINPTAFHPLMKAYISAKQQHPSHEAVLITGNHLTSHNSMLQTFQHTYTVGLKNQRCNIWHDPSCLLRSQKQLSSIFKASIAGANASIMLDSRASGNCISEDFCHLMKIKEHPICKTDMITADGRTASVEGVAVVSLKLQTYKAKLRFMVIPMATDCDAILGEPWHTATKAVMTYGPLGLETVRLYKGRTMRKILQYPQESTAWASKPGLLNHLQFAKASEHNSVFVAYVNLTKDRRGEDDNEDNPSKNKKMNILLPKYSSVFQPLPKGLPPYRFNIGHSIPLQPGAIPPYRSPYIVSSRAEGGAEADFGVVGE